ncbi:MAG: insulinase family protein [Verrucomicrobia bacterium]|nr:insulinase family protein [Verrucomicrobiota bacterium]
MNMPISLFHSLLTALFATTMLTPALAADRQYDFQQKTLANGLRVISLEDFSCPVVAVQVWYHVGSKNEDPARQGFAHMFEHMMFRGTDRLGPKDHFELIRGTGGDCNAYTAFDNTTYVNSLPSNQLELALWLEAERMAFLKIDQESFDTERKVVEEERRLGLNAPYGTVPEKVLPVLFKNHPYRWSTIGQIPHLRAASIDELQAFWEKWYVPKNATLVIVGAVKHADAQGLAEKYFAWIPTCPDPGPRPVREPAQDAPREALISEEKGPAPIVGFVYRTAPVGHKDAVPMEMLMSIVGGGESSRLNQDLVKNQKICQAAMAGAMALEDDGLAGAGAVMMPWGDKAKVLAAVETHLKKILEEPVTERELTKVKNQMLRQVVTGALTVANKASLIGEAATIERDPERVNRRLEEIRAVTVEDVQRVAKTYLTPERQTTVRVEPSLLTMFKNLIGFGKGPAEDEGAAALASGGPNRVAPRTGAKAETNRPESFPARPPKQPLLEEIPDVPHVDRTLPNGLKVVVIPNHEVPFVTMTLGLKYGAWAEDPAKPGVASMTLSMLDKGTKRRTAAEFAEETEFNAISVGGSAGMDVASVSASCVADKVALTARLLAEVVLEQAFPEEEFKILRQQTELGLMISSKEPNYVADREFRRRLYGEHPYARTATGEVADLQRMTTDDLKAWWKTHARPDAAVLFIAGDVQPEAMFKLAEETLGPWKSEGPAPQPRLAPIPPAAATRIYLVDRPGSVQSQIRVGHFGVTREHPDYHAVRVLSQILGGGFNSRLNEAIRVKRGLTYGAGGGFSAQRFAGQFEVSTFSKTPKTTETIGVLLEVLNEMRAAAPTDEELDNTRSYLTGSFAGQRETPQATVGDLWLIEYAKLPADYFRRALAAYKRTTAGDVRRVASSLIDPKALCVVVVGDAKQLRADLEKIAPVTLVSSDEPSTAPAKPGGSNP